MHPLTDLLDDLRAEGVEIVRLAAGHQPRVDVNLLVDPVAAGVADVRLEARPGRERPPLDDAGLDESPGAVADCGHRLPGLEEGPRERDCLVLRPKDVRVR